MSDRSFMSTLLPQLSTEQPRKHPFNLDMVISPNVINIYAELPGGLSYKDIILDFISNRIIISYNKFRTYDNPDISEIVYGAQSRVVYIPYTVTDKNSVIVKYKKGMLYITINITNEMKEGFSLNVLDEKTN